MPNLKLMLIILDSELLGNSISRFKDIKVLQILYIADLLIKNRTQMVVEVC